MPTSLSLSLSVSCLLFIKNLFLKGEKSPNWIFFKKRFIYDYRAPILEKCYQEKKKKKRYYQMYWNKTTSLLYLEFQGSFVFKTAYWNLLLACQM